MSEICLHPEKLLGLLTEIGRHRALSDDETDILEAILEIETVPFRWNSRLDAHLLTAAHSNGGIARFARRHEITPTAAYARLHRLRRRASGEKVRSDLRSRTVRKDAARTVQG